jgi:hypothetical protein
MTGIASKIACSASTNNVRRVDKNARLDKHKHVRHNGVEKGKIRKSTEAARAATARHATSVVKLLCSAASVRVSYAAQPTRNLFRENERGRRRRRRRIWLPQKEENGTSIRG